MKTIVSTAAAKERERIRSEKRRRAAGVRPRQVYLAESLTAQQPWKEEGISRATWYRRRKRINTEFIKGEIKTDTSRTVYLYGEAQEGAVASGQPQPVASAMAVPRTQPKWILDWERSFDDWIRALCNES